MNCVSARLESWPQWPFVCPLVILELSRASLALDPSRGTSSPLHSQCGSLPSTSGPCSISSGPSVTLASSPSEIFLAPLYHPCPYIAPPSTVISLPKIPRVTSPLLLRDLHVSSSEVTGPCSFHFRDHKIRHFTYLNQTCFSSWWWFRKADLFSVVQWF